MSWSKRITINYHYIETLNTNFSTHLNSELVTAYNTDKAFSFEKGPSHFLVKVNDKIELDGNIAYFISLVKKKIQALYVLTIMIYMIYLWQMVKLESYTMLLLYLP